jgi:hypothetical protein
MGTDRVYLNALRKMTTRKDDIFVSWQTRRVQGREGRGRHVADRVLDASLLTALYWVQIEAPLLQHRRVENAVSAREES